MRFNYKIINQICDNVITAVADPEITITGDYVVNTKEYEIIVNSIGNAIGPDYCIGTDNGYFGPEEDFEYRELTIYNLDYDIVDCLRFQIVDIVIA